VDDPVVRREPYRGGGQPVFIDTTLGYLLVVSATPSAATISITPFRAGHVKASPLTEIAKPRRCARRPTGYRSVWPDTSLHQRLDQVMCHE
jgi:hypothetical protein